MGDTITYNYSRLTDHVNRTGNLVIYKLENMMTEHFFEEHIVCNLRESITVVIIGFNK